MSSERVLQKDLYGFPISVTKEEQAERVRCFKKSKKRQARDWAFETAHRHIPASVSHEDMKRRCRKGIPTELRSFVWMEISGASQKKAQYASSYFVSTATAPVEGEAHEGHLKQIDLDVPRTFPEHAFFKSHQGQRALTMTLRALAVHIPEVGYCQSLNYVAGLLLLVLDHDPEDAFWVLVVLIESKLVPGTYDSGISGCLREVRVLEGLLQRKMPAVSKHLKKRDVDLIAVVPQWFLSLFSQDFPFETAVRVFDALLFEGSKILHRVALAMFKLTEPRLLQATDTMAAALSLRSAALRMHDRDLIMRTAVRRIGPLSQAMIDKLRASQQPESILSAFISRITARKPAKSTPWQTMGNPGTLDDDPEDANAQESMIGTAKNAAVRSDVGMLPRRHSSSGLRTMQYTDRPLDRRSMDAPPPIDLLASMGGVGLMDTNVDASSVATSPRSVQQAHQTACSSSDSHDPRTAQLMQVQAVLDHASSRREQEFTHTEAFNFTQVKVVKVSEAAKLSVRSPLPQGGAGMHEEGDQEGASAPAVLGALTAAGSSSSGGTQSYMHAPHARVQSLPMEARYSDGSGGTGGIVAAQNSRRTFSMHGDVRTVLAAADERAASGNTRSPVLQDRSSGGTGGTAGTTGTEGSPMTFKLPYPPTHVCGGSSCEKCDDPEEGAGLRALLREAAGSGRIENVSERNLHLYNSEAVGEAVAAGQGHIRPAMQRPVAVNAMNTHMVNNRVMGGHNSVVPAIAEEASVGRAMADLQFASDFELDFRNFSGAGNVQNVNEHNEHAMRGQESKLPIDRLMPHSFGSGGSQQQQQQRALQHQHQHQQQQQQPQVGELNASMYRPPHAQFQGPRQGASAPRMWDSNQQQRISGYSEVSAAPRAEPQVWQWDMQSPQSNAQKSETAVYKVSPGSYSTSPDQIPGQMLQPPRSVHEMISNSGGLPPASASGMHSISEDPERESAAASNRPRTRAASPTRPHNAYSGMYPMPLVGRAAAVPAQQLPGGLSPGIVHGLMPIEALGFPNLQTHSPPPDPLTPEMPMLPEGQVVNHNTSELAAGAYWPSGANMPSMLSSARMGRFVDGLYSQGAHTPASGVSDMWYTASEFPPDAEPSGSGSGGSHPSSLASSQPGTCGFPMRLCN